MLLSSVSELVICPTPNQKFNWIIFCITLLNWEFLKKYNFVLKILLKQRIVALYHDFHWLLGATKKPSFINFRLRSLGRVGNFGKVGVGVRHCTLDSTNLVLTYLSNNDYFINKSVENSNKKVNSLTIPHLWP